MTAKKPDYLKVIAGTVRADRKSPEKPLPPLTSMPVRPSWLSGVEGVREWKRLSSLMMKNQMLNGGNFSVLAHYCGLHDALSNVWLAGNVPHAATLQTYRGLAASLGLLSFAMEPLKGEQRPNKFANNSARNARA